MARSQTPGHARPQEGVSRLHTRSTGARPRRARCNTRGQRERRRELVLNSAYNLPVRTIPGSETATTMDGKRVLAVLLGGPRHRHLSSDGAGSQTGQPPAPAWAQQPRDHLGLSPGHRQRRDHRDGPRTPRPNGAGHRLSAGLAGHVGLRIARRAQVPACPRPRGRRPPIRPPTLPSGNRSAPRTRKRERVPATAAGRPSRQTFTFVYRCLEMALPQHRHALSLPREGGSARGPGGARGAARAVHLQATLRRTGPQRAMIGGAGRPCACSPNAS